MGDGNGASSAVRWCLPPTPNCTVISAKFGWRLSREVRADGTLTGARRRDRQTAAVSAAEHRAAISSASCRSARS